ncbi:MAG: hypothetical protein JXB04_00315 [Kiritimatiellae bacterium]|nr:hypothetical protein [Kiritimatiellia bacterium]
MSRVTPNGTSHGGGAGAGPWHEWRERCALGLCCAETQQVLRAFAAEHFARIARRHAHLVGARGLDPRLPADDAWHLLETHMTIRENRAGKRYKEWLFARAAPEEEAVAAIEGGAVVMLRDVVREYLRRELSPSGTVSMQTPVAGTENDVLMLEDLLPGEIDPANEVARAEMERLAAEHAREFLGGLDERSRLVMTARANGVPLSGAAMESATGCRKSMLHGLLRDACERLVLSLRSRYKKEDPAAVRTLVVMTLEAANDSLRSGPDSAGLNVVLFKAAVSK